MALKDDIRAKLAELNDPVAPTLEGMVCQVWEDGELSMQKSGSLLHQRHNHLIESGSVHSKLPFDLFPNTNGDGGNHGFLWTSYDKAQAARAIVLKLMAEWGSQR